VTGYVLSPAAEADLDGIWQYTSETWDIDQADRYVTQLIEAFSAVATGALRGRPIEEVRTGYLKIAAGSHFIVFRLAGAKIEIIRILHQRMDIPSRLTE